MGDGGRGGPFSNPALIQRYKLGVWVGVGGIVMFFAALTSAMVRPQRALERLAAVRRAVDFVPEHGGFAGFELHA